MMATLSAEPRPEHVKLIGSPGVTPVSVPEGTDAGYVRPVAFTVVEVAVSVIEHAYDPPGGPAAPAAVAVMTDAPMAAPMNPPTRAKAPIADPIFRLPNKVDLL
jgi:hypothetical protein